MRQICLILLMLAIIAIVGAELSNVTWISYIRLPKQSFNDRHNEYMQNHPVSRDIVKEQGSDEYFTKGLHDILEEDVRSGKFSSVV